jgi:hypothetical protein
LALEDTAFVIQGLREGEWRSLVQRFLFLHPPHDAFATEQGRLLLDENLKHQFFVRGIWINEDTSLSAGVDFADLRLDRDRAAVLKHSEIEHQMSSMWVRATHLHPALLPRYFAVLASDQRTSDVAFADLYCDDDTASAVAAWFVQQHGDVVPIAAKDATSAKMQRVRNDLERAAMVCSAHLLAVLKKGGVQCDLDVLFTEAASRSKKYIPASSLSEDELACLMHGCALASRANPEHPVHLSEVDVIEFHGVVLVEANQLVQPSEAFSVTGAFNVSGRFEVNRIALNQERLHSLLGGCLTPLLGSGCRCREAELARAIGGVLSGAGPSCPGTHGPRRLVAQLAAEVCGGDVQHCAAMSSFCSGQQLSEQRELALRRQIIALEDTLGTERQTHQTAVSDLNAQVKEAMQEIAQHEFKIMDVHDSVRKEFCVELEKWKSVATDAKANELKVNKAQNDLDALKMSLCKQSQEAQYLQRRIEELSGELNMKNDALDRRNEAAAQREMSLRSALARRAEMLQALLVNHDQAGIEDAERTKALHKVCQDITEERLHVCCVCIDAPPKVVLLPCRHQHLCSGCAGALSRCPICRVEIHDRVEVYS